MRPTAIFALLICLVAPSLGQQTATDWLNAGQILYDQGKYDEAIQAYNRAINYDPQLADAWYNKGLALDKEGRSDEAQNAYNKAINLNPSLTRPTEGVGSIYGPEQAAKAEAEANRCADLQKKLDAAIAEQTQLEAQTNSEQRETNINYVKKQISNINVQLTANGCKKGTITDITGSNPASQPSSPTTRTATTTTGASGPWIGTWVHEGGTLELYQNDNAKGILGELASNLYGPRIAGYLTPSATYAGILSWNTIPYDNKHIISAVFAFVDNDTGKLKARFSTSSPAFEKVLSSEQYSSGMQTLPEYIPRIGTFEIQKSGPNQFTGSMSPARIIDENEGTYALMGSYPFNAERRTSPETNPSSNSDSNTGISIPYNSGGTITGGADAT